MAYKNRHIQSMATGIDWDAIDATIAHAAGAASTPRVADVEMSNAAPTAAFARTRAARRSTKRAIAPPDPHPVRPRVIAKPKKLWTAAEVDTVLAKIAPHSVLIMPKIDGHAAVYTRDALHTRNTDVSHRLIDLALPQIGPDVQVLGELVAGRFIAYGARGLDSPLHDVLAYLAWRGFDAPCTYALNGLAAKRSIREAVTGICRWADWDGLPTDGRVIVDRSTGKRWAVKALVVDR